MKMLPPSDGMDALRTLTSALGHYDPDAARQLAAGVVSQVGAADRPTREPGRDLGPDAAGRQSRRARSGDGSRGQLPLHADAASGRSPTAIRAMDIALTLHADHELNASTFAARVAAATLTDVHSAIVAGIGTLKGPLHGGANAEVMKMLLEIGAGRARGARRRLRPRQARAQGEDLQASGIASTTPKIRARRTCGGCRRSLARRPATRSGSRCRSGSKRSCAARRSCIRTSISTRRRRTTRWGSRIDLYTPIFAVSRISGWTAHVLEQYANNRLIRPRADYIGPAVSADVDAARAAVTSVPGGSASQAASFGDCFFFSVTVTGWFLPLVRQYAKLRDRPRVRR